MQPLSSCLGYTLAISWMASAVAWIATGRRSQLDDLTSKHIPLKTGCLVRTLNPRAAKLAATVIEIPTWIPTARALLARDLQQEPKRLLLCIHLESRQSSANNNDRQASTSRQLSVPCKQLGAKPRTYRWALRNGCDPLSGPRTTWTSKVPKS